MDGRSRAKLVKAGYMIFRMRDRMSHDGITTFLEIREKSRRGNWILYGRYPSKKARQRAWDDLMVDPMSLAEEIGRGDDKEEIDERQEP